MANLRYGLKEVANVVFFDISTGKPSILFDTLKVSTIENESESAEARGGQGNGRLMTWDYGRTATLTMEDALLSDNSLAMLAGTTAKSADVKVVGRDTLTVSGDTVTLLETPVDAEGIYVFKYQDGLMGEEVAGFTVTDKDVLFTDGVTDGEQVLVFYDYIVASGAKQVTFNANAFPATYRVVGDTIVRGEDGVDRRMQFVIPRAKLQSGFSLTMDAENVSTFDFNLDVMVEAGTGKLYDIIRLDTNN